MLARRGRRGARRSVCSNVVRRRFGSWRTDSIERQVRARRARPRSWTRFVVLAPLRHVGDQIDAERAAGARTRATDASVAVEIARADQRLQDAVRRDDHRERSRRRTAARGCRRGRRRRRGASSGLRDLAIRCRARVEHRRRAIDADERRRRRAPAAARRGRCRSRARAPARRACEATRCQNGTSRRPSVCAFSQS